MILQDDLTDDCNWSSLTIGAIGAITLAVVGLVSSPSCSFVMGWFRQLRGGLDWGGSK